MKRYYPLSLRMLEEEYQQWLRISRYLSILTRSTPNNAQIFRYALNAAVSKIQSQRPPEEYIKEQLMSDPEDADSHISDEDAEELINGAPPRRHPAADNDD